LFIAFIIDVIKFENMNLSDAVAETWKNQEIRAKRSARHRVEVYKNGKLIGEYSSTEKACRALELGFTDGEIINFRMRLKKSGSLDVINKGGEYLFKAIPLSGKNQPSIIHDNQIMTSDMNTETVIDNDQEVVINKDEQLSFDMNDVDEEDDIVVKGTLPLKIFTIQSDPQIEGLYSQWKRGRLDVQPDFQRYFVWDIKKSSRLIESALLDIPLPVVYLTEENDGKIYVIDGQQRLTSFFSFIDGNFPNTNSKDFKLSGLKVLRQYEGLRFNQLEDDVQEKIRVCTIRTITFKKESNQNLKFEIFERLNTGAVPLNTQELRNCIYRGKFNQLLKEMAQEPDFLRLLNLKRSDPRMKDVELVLRFCAFYHKSYINYKSPIKNFLNEECELFNNISESNVVQLKEAFKKTINIIWELFGEHAFKRYYKGKEGKPDGYWEMSQFNASLFDVMMDSFARIDKNIAYANLDAIREAFIDLMTTDVKFIDAIEKGTSNERQVYYRFDAWKNTLNQILVDEVKQPRCFTYNLKQQLYGIDSTCGICGNNILHIDDAVVDHIHQYWRGGKTIPENARLAHRYCNASRPRKD
jgi:hypothetical protein